MSQPIKGAPAVELALQNTFNTYFNGEVDNVWAAWAAQDVLDKAAGLNPPPAGVYPQRTVRGPRKVNSSTPNLSIMCLDSAIVGSIGGMNGISWSSWEHHVVIIVTCSGSDELSLDEFVKRYVVAMWEVISKHPQLDGSLIGAVGPYTMSQGKGLPTKLKDQQKLVQEGGLDLVVRLDESA